MTHKLGIIGAGAIGQKHAAAICGAGAAVARVVDLNPASAEALASEYGGLPGVEVEAIWSDPEVDAVVIGVPNRFHKDLAVAAMESGKDVLLEKPMAMNTAECREINAVSEETGRVLQIGFVHRYTGVGLASEEFVASGRLGELYHIKAHLHFRRGVPGLGSWFTTKEIAGGGALIDVGVHLIDLAMHVSKQRCVESVLGQVYSRFGRRMRDYVYEEMWAGPPNYDGVCDVEDSAHALIRFAGGATLDLHVAWAGNYPSETFPTSMMGFFGDQGGISFELFGDHLRHSAESEGRLIEERIAVEETHPFRDQMSDFLEAISSRNVRGANGQQGEQVQTVLDAIYDSSTETTTVALN